MQSIVQISTFLVGVWMTTLLWRVKVWASWWFLVVIIIISVQLLRNAMISEYSKTIQMTTLKNTLEPWSVHRYLNTGEEVPSWVGNLEWPHIPGQNWPGPRIGPVCEGTSLKKVDRGQSKHVSMGFDILTFQPRTEAVGDQSYNHGWDAGMVPLRGEPWCDLYPLDLSIW